MASLSSNPSFCRPPARRLRVRAGFTIVEILATLLVLVIGLASVLSVVLASRRSGQVVSDRNNAVVIIPEALADIERRLLITTAIASANNLGNPQNNPAIHDYTGEYMDTLNLDNTDPNQQANPFATVNMTTFDPYGQNNHSFQYKDLAYVRTGVAPVHNLAQWPLDKFRSRTMGQFPVAPQVNPLLSPINSKSGLTYGLAYRGLFKLEPHPDWYTNRDQPYNNLSPYVGVYVLTFTLYRDTSPAVLTNVSDPTKAKNLIQVADPVIVFLKKKNL